MELRKSPLNDLHVSMGAKLVEFGGWNMPIAYETGTVREHLACRNDAVWFDVSHLGTVRLEGADAFKLLQDTLTNDLNKIAPGRAQYTHLLNDDASVLDDIIIWWIDEEVFDVMPNASNTANVQSAIGGTDTTATRAIVAIQGPNARAYVEKISSAAANIAHFGVGQFLFEGNTCTVAGTGYTGEDGVECAVPISVAESFVGALNEVGVMAAGLGARDTLRLESALPLHGHELGPGITPLQANLSWVVGWDKDHFHGRSALQEEKARGVSRKLFGMITDGRQPLREHCQVFVSDTAVGETSSGNFSPVLEKGIALGFLQPDMKIGDNVEIEVRGKRIPAQIIKTPFVKKAGS